MKYPIRYLSCNLSEDKRYLTAYLITPNFYVLEGESIKYE
jgi:hypothetical protein